MCEKGEARVEGGLLRVEEGPLGRKDGLLGREEGLLGVEEGPLRREEELRGVEEGLLEVEDGPLRVEVGPLRFPDALLRVQARSPWTEESLRLRAERHRSRDTTIWGAGGTPAFLGIARSQVRHRGPDRGVLDDVLRARVRHLGHLHAHDAHRRVGVQRRLVRAGEAEVGEQVLRHAAHRELARLRQGARVLDDLLVLARAREPSHGERVELVDAGAHRDRHGAVARAQKGHEVLARQGRGEGAAAREREQRATRESGAAHAPGRRPPRCPAPGSSRRGGRRATCGARPSCARPRRPRPGGPAPDRACG